jgi:Myb-like DNA-binding domain
VQGTRKDWNRIAAKFQGRTNKDCRKRWLKVHKNLQRGPWDITEDMRLLQGIQLHKFRWTKVAKVVETRHADRECFGA